MKNDFLNKLLNYYDLTLKIDNVLGVKIKNDDISNYRPIRIIKENYENCFQENSFYNTPKEITDYIPVECINNGGFDTFVDKLSFLEKSINLDGAKINPKTAPEFINDHEKFVFSKESNLFQYGIVYNLICENAYNYTNELVPCFIMLFPNYDDKFKLLSPTQIFIFIKKYLNIELDEEEIKLIFDISIKPYLIFNSKILEPYSLETPSIQTNTHNEIKVEVNNFMQQIIDLKKIKDEDLERKFLQTEFIIGIPQNLNMGLTKIYNFISEHNNINELLKSYFSIHNRKETEFNTLKINENEIIDSNKVVKSYSQHLGSFDKDYPLATTQRDALTCYLQEQKILPINGAPGTGKTSLLRAIFGDYTVKSAIETYKNYIDTKAISFSTPIVCSSTNNQALSNVSEGIESGFLKVINDNPNTNLYNRWIDEDKIKFSNTMFVPSIKGSKKTKYELTKLEIQNICNTAAKNPIKFLQEYFKYRGSEIKIEKVNKRTLDDLNAAATYFFNKIMQNVKQIENLIVHIENESAVLGAVEKKIVIKYISKGIQEELIKATLEFIKSLIIKSPLLLEEYNNLQNDCDLIDTKIKNLIVDINDEQTKSLLISSDILNLTNNLEALNNQIILENSYLDNHLQSPLYNESIDIVKTKFNSKFLEGKELILSELSDSINDIRNKASLIDKISYNFLKNGKIKMLIDEANEKIKGKVLEYNTSFWEEEFIKSEIYEIIKNKHEFNIKELKDIFSNTENKIITLETEVNEKLINISYLESDIDKLECKKRVIESVIDEKFEILSENVFEIDDIRELLKLKNTYISLNTLKQKNDDLDRNLRTDNFYYSLHLLESLFFISNSNMWDANVGINSFSNKSIVCPACKKKTFSFTTETNNTVTCSNNACNIKYSFLNPNNPKELNKYEIEHVIKHKKAHINGKTYYTKVGNGYINIEQKENSNIDNFSFNEIYPLFPLINITCNSFGTMVSSRNSAEIKKDLFNFMLIDEAGTIPPNKMVILNCAKRVMFFGDVKQLKPVFAYETNVENRILEDFFTKEEERDYVARFFSCAAKTKEQKNIKKNNNAMYIGNSSCNYFLPYNKSKMEGDIWLKEHFRCQTPIIEISNEISYFNEVIPCKKYHPDLLRNNLQFVEHNNQKSNNNTNIGEIDKIIEYIEKYKSGYINKFLKILRTKDGIAPTISDEDYYNSIGIITPFSNQENLLKRVIREKIGVSKLNPKEPIIKVGTVHKFQGSEREIIIFSSVYNRESIGKTKNLFFNREDPDMINVAVTRSKEIFVLFGNKEVLNDENTYSGVMIKHIEKFKNEMKNI